MPISFRTATRQDTGLLLEFIRELADYENMREQVVASEEILGEWLFEKGIAEAFFVMEGNREVGFALYFYNFSTFLGRGGNYLEDLYVLPAYRGRGYGKAILQRLAKITLEKGCGRLEWAYLDWNRPSIDFYRSLGAVALEDWTVYRVSGETLERLAEE